MSKICIRIELNGPPTAEYYTLLHAEMAAAGCSRYILGDSGRWWKLPDAMYIGTAGAASIAQVRDVLGGIIERVWHDYELIVFFYTDAAWIGLQPTA